MPLKWVYLGYIRWFIIKKDEILSIIFQAFPRTRDYPTISFTASPLTTHLTEFPLKIDWAVYYLNMVPRSLLANQHSSRSYQAYYISAL